MDKREITIKSQKIYDGRIINLRVDEVLLPNGRVAGREIVEHKGAVAVVPITIDNKVVMVKQYRKPAEDELWEIPAGKLEAGEQPEECAKRELEEETGYSGEIKKIYEFYTSPGFSDEYIYLYLATGLVPGKQHLDPDELLDMQEFSMEEIKDMLTSGAIRDAKTIIGIEYILMESMG
ncbi:NUDIX hydrolase [Calorimonas adulescens]|uniref:NUDIX hydrolase n=1 Tax=Calorimonas adulescens TaxID=2606906 RepID=A0A5D8QJH0_9THEO|nr:NUDIX hydrolase [Calorimonas adulescens]TZE83428.1 NUDIX hydrolase [Calorimonas adulescens]